MSNPKSFIGQAFSRRSFKVGLILVALSVLLLGLMVVYYVFHLGVKPCEGLPTDAQNCGDADFGGLFFIMAAVPAFLIGVIALVLSSVSVWLKRTKE